MNGIDFEKLQNHNEPGRTLHGTSFVEIVAAILFPYINKEFINSLHVPRGMSLALLSL
ncbi:hypothetical protein T11_7624 [Trichinella zimbabwensis]|uniref:Uncharacterized protein n=1 Tax=Trichinella zimbabwensis TaxID=268475 RepID=A0A0V1GXJ5_9BILA|nr:hypothetical protein T11_7624 [Trichinella zimbabwensis]